MVQIGKDNPLYNLYKSGFPVKQKPVEQQPVVQQQAPKTDLQTRLEAIDKPNVPTVFNQTSAGAVSNNDNLMARLDAIGTGELKPKTGRDFDIIA